MKGGELRAPASSGKRVVAETTRACWSFKGLTLEGAR